MVCTKCHKPYAFLPSTIPDSLVCLRCGFRDVYRQPEYKAYLGNKYGHLYSRTRQTDPQMNYILKKMDIKPSDVVVDIGCGVGDYTSEVHSLTVHSLGLDLDVKSAQKKYPQTHFIQHDLNLHFPLNDDSADALISINVIEHLINHEYFLSECRRVLKPGGRIAIATANLDFMLHNYFFDSTHLHEWTLAQFSELVGKYFHINESKKSSSMFNYYPYNKITTKFLKPDLLIIGKK